MGRKYKNIIFDLDGTLLDTEEMNMIPLQRIIKEELGEDIEYKELLKYMSYPGLKTMKELGFKDIEKSYSKWVKYVNEYEKGAILYDGVGKVLEILKDKEITCSIASSKTKKQYEIDFIKTGLDKHMDLVVVYEDTERHKPYGDPIVKAIGVHDKTETVYVGDTISDYKASKDAGVKFVLAKWGCREKFDEKMLKEIPVLEKIEDLLNLV